ncbi:MAG: hypothetical protein F6K11_37080 [Leptolyngbya sp. SIO3F4]|nr:hypothetical protein [Leptolyngbya sp. SIO3F4]
MADSNTTKLPKWSWPVWVGVSLLLHAGALAVALPTILRVDPPPSRSSVDIPVTLVDEGNIPSPASEVLPPEPTALGNAVQQTNLLGDQKTIVEAQVNNQTVAQQGPLQEIAPKKPATSVNTDTSKKPVVEPINNVETPDEIEIPDEVATETPVVVKQPTLPAEETQSSESGIGDGAIAISIVDTPTVAAGTPGDWPDILPTLQSTSTLSLSDHTCNDALPAGEVTLGLLIGADGSIIQVFEPPDASEAIAAQTARCLITQALKMQPAAIRFKPAYTGQQSVITDRIQLTLRFSAS